jgi:uncharacterized protein
MANSYRARIREIRSIVTDASQSGGPAQGPTPSAASPSVPASLVGPSFNCRRAYTRSEINVCNDPQLGSLDRQMASQMSGAMLQGTPAQRALLESTRSRFLRYREACPSNSCMAATYRSRMREISDIMLGRWRVP